MRESQVDEIGKEIDAPWQKTKSWGEKTGLSHVYKWMLEKLHRKRKPIMNGLWGRPQINRSRNPGFSIPWAEHPRKVVSMSAVYDESCFRDRCNVNSSNG